MRCIQTATWDWGAGAHGIVGTGLGDLTIMVLVVLEYLDKTGLGYNSPLNERDLSNKSDVFESAFDSSVNESEEENNQANDRYKADEGYHAVPLPYTGSFMPLRPDLSFAGLDDFVFQSAISETVTSVNKTKTSSSKTSKEISTAGDAVNAASVIPDVSVAGPSTSTAEDIFEYEMTTMVDTLMAIRRTRQRTTSLVIHDVEEEPRKATPPPTVHSQDKEQRIAKEKAAEQEAKDAVLIEQMEDVQARIDADVLLAERLQQEKSKQFTVDEQARMLVDLIAERKSKQQAERSKKRSRADHDKESVKKQKLKEDDAEKEELRACLDIEMLSRMLNRRLEIDHESEMAFEHIRFIKTQLKE
nr:hypothetical protein [Tanacetum cinerariifolium]